MSLPTLHTTSAFAKLFIVPTEGAVKRTIGPGAIALLQGVSDEGSLNKAAKGMQMSYSKAWTLINSVEESLGVSLIERNGAHGSNLTREGHALIRAYDTTREELDVYAQKTFADNLAREREKFSCGKEPDSETQVFPEE